MRFANLTKRLIVAVALIAISTTTVQAGGIGDMWNSFVTKIGQGYKRNNAWPEPFRELDAVAVIAPFETMKSNGWRLNNTLGNEAFRVADNALQPSGRDTLSWIATQAPESRRHVFVVRAQSDDDTQARVTSVEQSLQNLNLQGAAPQVTVIDRIPPTYSGPWATQINRRWLEQLPDPKLPSQTAQGSATVTQ